MKPFKIEKGLKVPPPAKPKSSVGLISRAAYTMTLMKVGDSFLVSDDAEAARATRSMRDYNGKGDKKFTSRSVARGTRIWRLA